MRYKLVKGNDQLSSKWSGGTTTQIYIYPENSSYPKKNFLFRISSAKVEVEESEFTSLEGVSRELMVLDGELFIDHKGQYSKKLRKFEKDSFLGDWKTISKGKVVDFNLMLANGAIGSLDVLILGENQRKQFLQEQGDILVLYMNRGSIIIGDEGEKLEKNDSVVFFSEKDSEEIKLRAFEPDTEIIISRIKLSLYSKTV